MNHFDTAGNAVMVDVSEKNLTKRVTVASGKIFVGTEIYSAIKSGSSKKGNVLGVARIAGIMAAKKFFRCYPAVSPVAA